MIQTCIQYGIIGNGQWCCQTDFCNTAKTIMLRNSISYIVGVFTVNFLLVKYYFF